jgi:hypothetical protein
MSWNTPDETVIAGTGQLSVAPVGTTLPAPNSDPTAALNPAFIGCGYTAEDGASFKVTPEITEHRVWQSTDAIRSSLKSHAKEIGVKLVQWNEATVVLAFGGGSINTSGGFPTYTFIVAGDALGEYAVVLDVEDGDRNFRFVFPRMNITDAVESQFNADNMAELPITLKALSSTVAPYWITDDAAAFAVGS